MTNLLTRIYHKAQRTFLKALRLVPACAALDDERYRAIEHHLAGSTSPVHLGPTHRILLLSSIIREFLRARTKYRVIDLGQLTASDCQFLDEHELSLQFLRWNHSNPSAQGSFATTRPLDIDFQLDALANGGIAILCPYNGELLRSHRSILAAENQPIYYRFTGKTVFYLAAGRQGAGYPKLYLYFPEIHTVVLLADKSLWLGRDEIDEFRAHIISNWEMLCDYFASRRRPSICALIDCNHFAHHLWNALPGLDRIFVSGHAGYLDQVIVSAEPFGPLEKIFPNLRLAHIKRASFPQLLCTAVRENLFLLRLGGTHISRKIIDRVTAVAHELACLEAKDCARHYRNTCWPVIWFTIRTGNRTWASQTSGIAKIAIDIKQRYPRAAFIVDGYSIIYGRPHGNVASRNNSIAQEQECVAAIRRELGNSLPIISTVGRSIFDATVYAQIADCYLAHHGSLQHKIAWLANAPGVVHSNREVLRDAPHRYSRALGAREQAVIPRYLSAECVINKPGAIYPSSWRWRNNLENYDFDYSIARDALLEIIRSLNGNGRMSFRN